MLPGLIRIIFYGLIALIIYQLLSFFQRISRLGRSPQPPKQVSGMMVKDEICDTYLPKEDAIKEIYQGKEFFFCSKECRQKFLETKH